MNPKEKLQAILDAANNTTSAADTDITAAVRSLIDGFGGVGEPYYSPVSGLPYYEDMYLADRGTKNTSAVGNAYRDADNLKRLYCGRNFAAGSNAFNGCLNLKEAVLNCFCGSEQFWNCSSLEKAVILENCVFQTYVFDSCINLMTVIIPENGVHNLPVNNIFVATSQFTTASGQGRIYVPRNQIAAYEAATNWSAYAGHYLAIEDYPEIASWEEWWK